MTGTLRDAAGEVARLLRSDDPGQVHEGALERLEAALATPEREDLRALIDAVTNDVLPRAKSETYLSVKARAQMQVDIADRVIATLLPKMDAPHV